MAAVIQSLQLNSEYAANVSYTSMVSRKKLSWHNQVNWKQKTVEIMDHACFMIHV